MTSTGNNLDNFIHSDSNKQKKLNSFKCTECDKEFGSATNLQVHLRHHRRSSGSSPSPSPSENVKSAEKPVPDSQTDTESDVKREIKEEVTDEDEHIDVEDQSLSTIDDSAVNRTDN